MTRDPAAVEEDVARLDAVLKPIATEPVDLDDPEWMTKLRDEPHAVDRAGVREEAEAVVVELLTRYAEDAAARPAIRALFERYSSFRWAAHPPLSITPEGVRFALLVVSAHDQASDLRDDILTVQRLCADARAAGVDVDPLLREVGAMSSDVDRYGMGSVRDLLLRSAR